MITRDGRKKLAKNVEFGARELPRWVRAVAILAEDRGLAPGIHVTMTAT